MQGFNISFNLYGKQAICDEWDAAHVQEIEKIKSKEKQHKELMEEELSKAEEENQLKGWMNFLEQKGKNTDLQS